MQKLSLSNGNSLFFRDSGKGKPLLLIHGWGVTGGLFQPQIEALSSQCRVIVPDLPGHGLSGPFSKHEPFSTLADSLAQLLKHLGVGDVCLVGWSLGAMIGWDLLRRYPNGGVSSMVSIDMVPRLLKADDWPYGLLEQREDDVFASHAQLIQERWPDYLERMIPRIFRPDHSDQTRALIDWALRIAAKGDPQSLGNVWQAMGTVDARANLPEITVPTLVVAGELSQLYGVPAARWLTQQLPNAQLEVFEHSGHAPHLEEPDRFNEALIQFMASTGKASPSENLLKPVAAHGPNL